MAAASVGEDDYEDTQAWRLALFFFCFGLVSVGVEHVLHHLLHYLSEKQKLGMRDVVNKLKDELMLLGFISLVLVLLQDRILAVCVPECGSIWGECAADEAGSATGESRRRLAAAPPIECGEGEAQFISLTALHQIHIFIFVLAVSLIGTGSAAMLAALGRLRTWAKWEKEHAEFDALLDGDQSAGSQVAQKWEELERSHSRCLYRYLWSPVFGTDKVTFLYMRRFFIRRHNRSKAFDFAKYVTACTEDEFARSLEIDGQDWLTAMLSVALREYWFTLWASVLSLGLSVLAGVKLSAIARMFGKVTRDMATGQLGPVSPHAGAGATADEEAELLAAAKTAFDQADHDSGGTLDREEVRQLLLELGCEVQAGDDQYFLQAFARFDIDDSGALEYDEFLQCYRFIQAHKRDVQPDTGDGGEQTQNQRQSLRRTFTLRTSSKYRPNLKTGRVTWCCGNFGPQLDPNRLRPLVNFIIFQNAIAMAQVVFNAWQVGTSSEYFTQPPGVPGGMLLLQGSLFALQMLHTSYVLLPMLALVRQMGKHYNARLFGEKAGKAITDWANRAKRRSAEKSQQGVTSTIIGGITKTRTKVIGLSPARLARRKEEAGRKSEEEHDQSRPSAISWEDDEPRTSIETVETHNATVNDGNGSGNEASASELLSQGKLPCLPPVPTPATNPSLDANSTTTAGANSELPPVKPPSPKAHPLGIHNDNP